MRGFKPRRRAKLRVVGAQDPSPRHELAVKIEPEDLARGFLSVRIWSLAEWDALLPAERPENVSLLPGFGWIAIHSILKEAADDIEDVRRQQRQYREFGTGR